MYMVNASEQKTSFWAKNKSLFAGVTRSAAMVVGLKMAKIVVDKLNL